MRRLTASLLTTLLAFTLIYYIAWIFRDVIVIGRGPYVRQELRGVGKALAEFAEKNGRYPESLKEQYDWATKKHHFRITDETGELMLRDPWHNQFQYESDGKSYRIYAVDRNGEISDIKLTGDLVNNPKGDVHDEPSFHRFLYESLHSVALFRVNFVSSILAGIFCFFLIPQLGMRRHPLPATALSVVVMTISSVIVSCCIILACFALE